ncbi:MAG: response regulator, partial [Deltaproteobacteria bacterium]
MAEHIPRILIVDDEKHICTAIAALVKGEGFQSLIAQDGNAGLRLIRSEAPDMMLVDIKMPEMDGMEVMRQAKDL